MIIDKMKNNPEEWINQIAKEIGLDQEVKCMYDEVSMGFLLSIRFLVKKEYHCLSQFVTSAEVSIGEHSSRLDLQGEWSLYIVTEKDVINTIRCALIELKKSYIKEARINFFD